MARDAPPPRQGPAFDDAGLAAAGALARGVWTEESGRERDRLLALSPSARLAALDDDAVRILLTEEHRAAVRASLAPETVGADPNPRASDTDAEREQRAAVWRTERRRMEVLQVLRPITAVAVVAAAVLPFAIAAWRTGLDPAEWVAAAVALVVAAWSRRFAENAESWDALAALPVAAFAGGAVLFAAIRAQDFAW